MGRYDVLDGQAAKPATAMPNHYILDIPPDESGQRVIYLRRFYIDSTLDLPESSADAQRRASIASRASREAESLEQAWRTINSSGMDRDASAQVSEAGGPARDILSRGPCAIVCPQTPSNLAALWTFSSSPSEPPIPEGMRGESHAVLPFGGGGVLSIVLILSQKMRPARKHCRPPARCCVPSMVNLLAASAAYNHRDLLEPADCK